MLKKSVSIETPNGTAPPLTRIAVNAENCFKRDDGKWVIEIPIRELSASERETIRTLFPHLYDNAYELLDKEALLNAMTL